MLSKRSKRPSKNTNDCYFRSYSSFFRSRSLSWLSATRSTSIWARIFCFLSAPLLATFACDCSWARLLWACFLSLSFSLASAKRFGSVAIAALDALTLSAAETALDCDCAYRSKNEKLKVKKSRQVIHACFCSCCSKLFIFMCRAEKFCHSSLLLVAASLLSHLFSIWSQRSAVVWP